MTGPLLRLAPWLALAVALVGGGYWLRNLQAERDTLAVQVEGLEASTAAWAKAYAESDAQHQAVVEALSRAHARIAEIAADRAAILEDLRHAKAPDCPVPAAVRDAVDRLWDDIGAPD